MSKRVLTYLPIVSSGGAERIAVDVLNGLAAITDNGLEHHLVTDRTRSTFLDQLSGKVHVHHLDDDLAPWRRAWRLGSIADKIQPDVIVAHMSHTALTTALARMLRASARRARFVTVEHSLPRHQFDSRAGLRAAVIRRLLVPVYRRADCVVCISDAVRADVHKLVGSACRLIVIRNGIDLDRIRDLAKETPTLLGDAPREGRIWIAIVGRLVT